MKPPVIVDTHMHGLDQITATFLVAGELTALIETGPKSSLESVLAGIEAAGIESLDWIVLTHIHLDHCGAAGTIAQRFPEARVAVHPRGARHLADPSRLWAGAAQIFGEAMSRMWGGIDPLDKDRIHVVEDGDKIDLGGRVLQVMETPGHAPHHNAYLDDATGVVFTGDALGVALPGIDILRPAVAPPDFDLELSVQSIRRMEDTGATELWQTHFGPSPDPPAAACARAVDALHRWAEWVRNARTRSNDLDAVTGYVREQALDGEQLASEAAWRMENAMPPRLSVAGYLRYLEAGEAASESSETSA